MLWDSFPPQTAHVSCLIDESPIDFCVRATLQLLQSFRTQGYIFLLLKGLVNSQGRAWVQITLVSPSLFSLLLAEMVIIHYEAVIF